MRRRHVAASIAVVSSMVCTAPAPGQAASVSPPEVLAPPARLPVDLPGRAYRQGMEIPRGHRLVSRRVTLDPRESLYVTMTCVGRRGIASLGHREEFPFGFRVVAPDRRILGRRAVKLDVFWQARFSPDRRASGSLYLLCRPR